ncbi:UDP-glucuronosyltransferase 2B4-like [Diadema antillarum]|uniref:UDP-glucuronosyltransferase 2B4-like n=1 Tax=Diadema antillarum TaxID=105358 RepID=UPI003A8BCAEA
MHLAAGRWMSTCYRWFMLGLLIACASSQVESANILVSGGLGDGSHFLSIVPIGRSLLQKGHNVTFLVADEYLHEAVGSVSDSKLFNFEVFHFPGLIDKMDEAYSRLGEIVFTESIISQQKQLLQPVTIISGQACRAVFEDPELLERMRWYDAYVLDVVWPCGVFVKSYLERHRDTKDIPIAIFAPMVPIPFIFDQSGSPFVPSYQPVLLTMLSSSMSFFERCENVFFYIFSTVASKDVFLNHYSKLVPEYNLDPDLTSTISAHVDLYFINSDISGEFVFSLMPNVIPVGGVTSRPASLLDEDLEEFMESSGDHGVLVFSLGSYFAQITTSHPHVIDMFIEAFSRIPQKVIMHS